MPAQDGVETIGVEGLTHGLTADETGVVIERFRVVPTQEQAEVKNRLGITTGLKFWNRKLGISIEGAKQGTTGLAAAAIGAVIEPSNPTEMFGVQGGTLILDKPQFESSQTDWQKLQLGATRYPGVETA